MYVVTFYSFKGGVGRTLALANVGLELAKKGRRVLLVDFDLEAPGIHTFSIMKPKTNNLGLVDYINQYTNTRCAPDVRDYIYEAKGIGKNDGRLWIMPTGTSDNLYSQKLHSINWQKLYKEQDGFIMFEDMKEQWNDSYEPDYVLIDSRTGHTDVGGICTRQLPDAVVILFFPNDQNLIGLKPIVTSIKEEDKKNNKETKLHFVMSNVPDLDDEDDILAGLEEKFQTELGYDSLTSTIHRYDSLSLLHQALFVEERPNSRLAKEYRKLTEEITNENIKDREGVIDDLKKRLRGPLRLRGDWKKEENRIDEIIKHYAGDGELLYLLAKKLKNLGRSKKSDMLLEMSINSGYHSPEALLSRADTLQKEGDNEEALECIWRAFEYSDIGYEELGDGVNILRRIAPENLLKIADTMAFKSLSPEGCSWIYSELNWCKPGLQASVDLLLKHYENKDQSVSNAESIKGSLLLSFIGLGKFKQALKLFGTKRPYPEDLRDDDSFNYAMAEWGLSNEIPKDMFQSVINKSKDCTLANYQQCMSIAFWAIGDTKEALARIKDAINKMDHQPHAEFSCWQYLNVTPEDFVKDCNLIIELINGNIDKPAFMKDSPDNLLFP
ncbi:MAG: ParA family protein [Planctomycetes bacterium]|nr:ParA family protein [Planctomycetota bacterium]